MRSRCSQIVLSLATLSLAVFAPASYASTSSGGYNFVFSLPATFTPSVPVGSPDLFIYSFGTASSPSQLVATDFTYDSNYQVDALSAYLDNSSEISSGLIGYTTDSNNQINSLTLNNGSTAYIPFSSVGGPASLTLSYYDATTSTPFTLQEQYTNTAGNLVTNTLLDGNFNGNGTFTPAGSAAVPEPAPLVLLSLGVLPLIGMARRRSTRK
jgi:hypothetical protein